MKKFALIGCGRIAQRHAENITRVGKLVAVCDIVREKADSFGQLYGANIYTDLDELLDKETDVDIVSVCTPNGLHAEHSIKSLQQKKHVLCEKPMCITKEAAWQIVDTAHFFRRKIFVVKQNRYNEPVQIIKKMLDENQLGKIESFQINCFWNRPPDYYMNSWKGSKILDGGILYTQFSHFIDLLYWFLGDVEKAQGYRKTFRERNRFEIEDTGTAVLQMTSGAIGNLQYTVNTTNRNLEGSLTLFGEKGTVKIGGQYLNTLEWFETSSNNVAPSIIHHPPNDYGFYQGSMSNHHKVYDDLLLSLEGKGNLLEAKDAVKTIEIIEKIYAGSQTL